MRLTLRTLLAYLDEVLEPADREELAKKVESSEFAHDLIHRTKDTMRRLRLSAPQVVGTGMGLDPNTVAEYLDNVLPPDAVADFERICLESDVHLAEVASAHHVLTMVLGEPADVDPDARQRMYGVPAEAEQRKKLRIEPAHPVGTGAATAAAITPPPSVYPHDGRIHDSHSDAIPDYLRASAWTRHGMLLAACAAVLLIAVSFLFVSGLTNWFGGEPAQVASNQTDTQPAEIEAPELPPLEPPTIPSPAAGSATAALPAESASSAPMAAPPRMMVPAMGNSVAPAVPPEEPSPATPAEIATDESAYGYGEPPAAAVSQAIAGHSSVATPPSVTPVLPASEEARQASAEVSSDRIASAESPPVQPLGGSESGSGEVAEEPAELGTYLDGQNVLLRYDPAAEAWFRMTARSTLAAGDRLLALPAFYPKLTLASGLHLKLAGGTLVKLGPAQAGGAPAIDIAFGKLVIVNTSNEENSVRLVLGGEEAEARLGRNASLAVDVERQYVPGQDPRQMPSPVVAQIFARDGEVTWEHASGSRTVTAPGQWTIENGAASAASDDVSFPDWIDQEPVEQRSEQLFGAPAVEQALDPTRPAEEQLLELYQGSRRREVKSLAARSAVYVGLFVPFVEALRDSEQRSTWKTHIETLRSAMALGPESADKIYQTLVDQRGQQTAADLYEMLCGYGPEQIGTQEQFNAGLGSRLVDRMENDSLDYRVLAVQDMAEITGMRLMSNPAGTPTERARGVRIWRQRLKDGEVEPVSQAGGQ